MSIGGFSLIWLLMALMKSMNNSIVLKEVVDVKHKKNWWQSVQRNLLLLRMKSKTEQDDQ
jgi:hypothetical protein